MTLKLLVTAAVGSSKTQRRVTATRWLIPHSSS
jgi:hypothetical protein